MKLENKIDQYLNEELDMNDFFQQARMGKTPDMTAFKGSIMDWAFDVLDVIENNGTPAQIKAGRTAVKNLEKSLKDVEVKKNMLEKIVSKRK